MPPASAHLSPEIVPILGTDPRVGRERGEEGPLDHLALRRHLLSLTRPDQPAYAEVGTAVKKGQVLCIIEAMKLMNEIESEVAGGGRSARPERPARRVRATALSHRAVLTSTSFCSSHTFAAVSTRESTCSRSADREPRRDRAPSSGAVARRRYSRPFHGRFQRTHVRFADESVCIGPPLLEGELPSTFRRCSRRQRSPGRCHPPRLRVPVGERGVRGSMSEVSDRLYRASS